MTNEDIAKLGRIVYTFSQTVCALARIESMIMANKERELQGEALAYSEDSFLLVETEYKIRSDQVTNYIWM